MTPRPGTAPMKKEYLIDSPAILNYRDDDDLAESASKSNGLASTTIPDAIEENESDGDGEPLHKKPRLSGAQRKKAAKEERKKHKGANKGRRFKSARDEIDLCWRLAAGKKCEHDSSCKFSHDLEGYLKMKPSDLYFPNSLDLSNEPPFIRVPDDSELSGSSSICPSFKENGHCRQGYKCRFLGTHVTQSSSDSIPVLKDASNVDGSPIDTNELNATRPGLFKLLRTRKYPTPLSSAFLAKLNQNEILAHEEAKTDVTSEIPETPTSDNVQPDCENSSDRDVPLRASEKKRLHWKGMTYLAPLTTVGNLPFRRLCVSLGADITCSEMGLATSYLSGSGSEWSLLRRHPSEKIFGVQVCGNKPSLMVPTAEVIAKECGENIDFVDLNCGCPIDLVFNQGSGSALMNSVTKLGKIVTGMNYALGSIPLTVKLRTGVKDGNNTAHKLMPRLVKEWGTSALAIHGRTRQQRYSRLADWDYIARCVKAVKETVQDEDLAPIPIFGGGDCFSSQGYWECVDATGVDGVMVARGALIKPWIFTEIKERREWDISSRERLDLIRNYAEYGLSHFGTDTKGVNTTRRFLCEALSFQYRYIPIGLLETLPGKINDRPPAFKCRDPLEDLLASPNSQDWVKISEMFLGKCPEDWSFTPKHRSNAYDAVESQG